jgi:hypothetical protein
MCFTRGAFGTTAATVQRSTVDGGNVTEIANSGQGDYNCGWSPDGAKIAYVQGIFGNGDLKVKSSDGTGTPSDLVPNVAGRFDGNPDWAPNPSPLCNDAAVAVDFNGSASIPLACTDPLPQSSSVTRSIVTPPAHGRLSGIANNRVTYTPAPNFSGTDQFTFKGNDGTSDSKVATVRLTVKPLAESAAAISLLRVAPARWRLGSALATIARARVGTTISFNMTKPARVTLRFARAAAGRKVGRRCAAPRPSNRKRKRCTRFVNAGALTFNGHAGLNRVKFQGRLSPGRRLSVGLYRLTVGATDSGGRRSRPVTASFRIVRR